MTIPGGIERRKQRGGEPLRLGLLGCGTVGSGVVRLVREHQDKWQARLGVGIEVRAVLVRDAKKERTAALDPTLVTTDATRITDDPEIDVVIDVMGGEQPALDYVSRAIAHRKSIVSANKHVLALHGADLLKAANDARVDLVFEGAVGGGIPIVRTLRESFASDRLTAISGIVNGTCNFILTQMADYGASYAAALAGAQAAGFAEADPTMDVGGHDAAHKITLLAMLGFGVAVPVEQVLTRGIDGVSGRDMPWIQRLGYVLKHVATASRAPNGISLLAVPTLVRREHVFANVKGPVNAIEVNGEAVGPALLVGRGAGAFPTAVSVVSDVVDVGRAILYNAAGIHTRTWEAHRGNAVPADDIRAAFFLRFAVRDRPGVIAKLAAALGQRSVSIAQIQQDPVKESEVDVVVITQPARLGDVESAMAALSTDEDFLPGASLLFLGDAS